MKLKKVVSLVCCIVMTLSLAACGSSSSSETKNTKTESTKEEVSSAEEESSSGADVTTFICSHTSAADSTKGIFVQEMADWLAENTDDLRMEVYPAGQLGVDAENAESVVENTIQMTLGATSNFINSIPNLAVFDGPFAFDSYEQIESAFSDAEFKKALDTALAENGVTTVGLRLEGFRTLFSNKPVTCYEDLENLQLRVMDSKNLVNMWTDLKASVTTVAYTELYTALQQGVVEAQENTSISTLTNYNLYEVTKYATVTKHGFTVDPFMINLEWYNGLTEQQKGELAEAFAYAQSTENDPAITEQETHETYVNDYGYEVYEFTDEDIEKCREATKSVWDDIAGAVDSDLYNAYLAVIEKYK